MRLLRQVPLQPLNSFGIAARARAMVCIRSESDVHQLLGDAGLSAQPRLFLGGGCNTVFTGDVQRLVLKMEVAGRHIVDEDEHFTVVEAGAGENWHDFVSWTLDQGLPGLENLALIPGSAGAAPVQNIGAYGVELQDFFSELDAIDLKTGQTMSMTAAQCAFAYRDSVFKHAPADGRGMGLAGRALIMRVRLALPKRWRPALGYRDIQHRMSETGVSEPTPRQLFDWVVSIRRGKLPDPKKLGNAGSFFKNPIVSEAQCRDIIGRDPELVHYAMPDGRYKLAAGWLIDACGWRGKRMGRAGVYDHQALVLVNRGTASAPVTGGEVMTLARAIQTSVYERFGIRLEPEPVVV